MIRERPGGDCPKSSGLSSGSEAHPLARAESAPGTHRKAQEALLMFAAGYGDAVFQYGRA
jgi:hypothetical protein